MTTAPYTLNPGPCRQRSRRRSRPSAAGSPTPQNGSATPWPRHLSAVTWSPSVPGSRCWSGESGASRACSLCMATPPMPTGGASSPRFSPRTSGWPRCPWRAWAIRIGARPTPSRTSPPTRRLWPRLRGSTKLESRFTSATPSAGLRSSLLPPVIPNACAPPSWWIPGSADRPRTPPRASAWPSAWPSRSGTSRRATGPSGSIPAWKRPCPASASCRLRWLATSSSPTTLPASLSRR